MEAKNNTTAPSQHKFSRKPEIIALFILGILFTCASIINATNYVIPLTGDMFKAVMFCLSIPVISVIVEYHLTHSSGWKQSLLKGFILMCNIIGPIGLVIGMTFEFVTDVPFDDWPEDWLWMVFIGQLALEISAINIAWSLVAEFRDERVKPILNAFFRIIHGERCAIEANREAKEHEICEMQGRQSFFRYRAAHSRIHREQAALLAERKATEDALVGLKQRLAFLNFKKRAADEFRRQAAEL